MSVIWNTPAGNLGILTERILIDIPLNASSSAGPVSMSLLAGNLPRGLRLIGNSIKGSPVEVKRFTQSKFVIRATDGVDLEDRTFYLSVDGSDEPVWITREGFLKVGNGDAYFVLDNAYVNFQLEVTDSDLTAGDQLEFYLQPQGGELPPGLSLSKDGTISGYTDPIFSVEYGSRISGAYDTASYDTAPLDVVRNNSNGFDTFLYDNTTYDYSEETRAPRKLSRYYTFAVAVTDGVYTKTRIFKIYVVTEEFLKADNNILQVDTNLFQADASSFRVPLWITESNLGKYRANNYLTVFLDVFDPPTLSGVITYFLMPTNPGTYRLKSTGEIINDGKYDISEISPRFSAVFKGLWDSSKSYTVGDSVIYTDISPYTFKGNWNNSTSYVAKDAVLYEEQLWRSVAPNINETPGEGSVVWKKIEAETWVCQSNNTNIAPSLSNPVIVWNKDIDVENKFVAAFPASWETVLPETSSEIPPGMVLDGTTGEIAGKVPYQSRVTESYKFTMLAVNFSSDFINANYNWRGNWVAGAVYLENDAVVYNNIIYVCKQNHDSQLPTNTVFWEPGVSSTEKTFNIDIIGEIESGIEWISDSDRGSIKPNQPSNIFVEARSLLYGQKVVYEFVSGELPPGLTFLPNGLIEGKVKQFGDINGPGLTRFFEKYIDVSNVVGSFIEGSTLTGSTSGSTAKVIYLNTETSRLYYNDVDVENPATFLDNENIFSGSTTAKCLGQNKEFEIQFDGGEITFNKQFNFRVKARDVVGSSERVKDFFITVISENNKVFSNLYLLALQNKSKRLEWFNFITDTDIFRSDDIYRYGDPNFGIQTELKMLVYAGIESAEAVKFVQAMSRNHYRKRLLFGNPKIAVAKDPFTQQEVYEAVYVEVIDDYEKNGKSISQTINLPDMINSRVLVSYDAIRVDSDIPFVSDRDHQRVFPNSIKNMRNRIKNVGVRDREFLPLWMRSIQDAQAFEPGYTKAIILCYAKPGRGQLILSRIKAKTQYASRGLWNNGDFYQINDSVFYNGKYYTCILNNTGENPENTRFWVKNFDFKNIDFDSDRYRIDSIDGNIEDKYLAFPQRGEKLP